MTTIDLNELGRNYATAVDSFSSKGFLEDLEYQYPGTYVLLTKALGCDPTHHMGYYSAKRGSYSPVSLVVQDKTLRAAFNYIVAPKSDLVTISVAKGIVTVAIEDDDPSSDLTIIARTVIGGVDDSGKFAADESVNTAKQVIQSGKVYEYPTTVSPVAGDEFTVMEPLPGYARGEMKGYLVNTSDGRKVALLTSSDLTAGDVMGLGADGYRTLNGEKITFERDQKWSELKDGTYVAESYSIYNGVSKATGKPFTSVTIKCANGVSFKAPNNIAGAILQYQGNPRHEKVWNWTTHDVKITKKGSIGTMISTPKVAASAVTPDSDPF